jgi:hypothetical protein
MSRPGTMTDEQLSAFDVDAAIVDGLAGTSPEQARQLFAEGAVAAALHADAAGVLPRALLFLAEVVRRGGLGYAAALPEPLPAPAQAQLVRRWMGAALRTGDTAPHAAMFARWLDAVAVILDLRRATRAT